MALRICLVISSRSSSDRCARLTARTSGFSFSFWARSFCRTFVPVAGAAAGEEAAPDPSCSSSSSNRPSATSFPAMSELRDKKSVGTKRVRGSVPVRSTRAFYTKHLEVENQSLIRASLQNVDGSTHLGRKCVKEATREEKLNISALQPFLKSGKNYKTSRCVYTRDPVVREDFIIHSKHPT